MLPTGVLEITKLLFTNVFISTYTAIYNGVKTNSSGPVIPLLNFFKSRTKTLYLLEQPAPGSDFMDTVLTIFDDGKEIEKEMKNFFFSKTPNERRYHNKTYIHLKLRDLFSNFYFILRKFKIFKKCRIDLFIGVECVNALFGVLMKRIGLVDKVVYYVFDWSPSRYANPFMNRLYIWLDKIATYYSDYSWNIAYTIEDARKNILGFNKYRMSPQLYVPYCSKFNGNKILPDNHVDTKLVIYAGALIEENGPQLLIEAFKTVAEQTDDSRLLIIGGGGIEQQLRNLIQKHGLEDRVEITGYIAEEEKIIDLQCKGAIGVAPYPFSKNSRKPYGDVIKIRMYFACGLVTVTTPVPPVYREIIEEKLGYCTKDDSPEEIAKGIIYFLNNNELLFQYRKNVITKARFSSWENNYINALKQMGLETKFKGAQSN